VRRNQIGRSICICVGAAHPESGGLDLLRRSGWLGAVLSTFLLSTAVAGCLPGGLTPGQPAAQTPIPAVAPSRTFSQWLDEKQVSTITRARWAAVARHNSIIVLNSWNFRLIPILKRANPEIRVWMYKDLSGIRSDDCTTFYGRCGHCPRDVADSRYLSSGMGYCWVKRHHPRWLLASGASGQPFQFRNYPGIWETDYGNRAYQRQWIHNVLNDVRDHGWSGVEVDNALTTADAYGIAAKYPSNATVQVATYSALRNIGHAMRDAGVASVFNVGYATSFPRLWQRWLRPVNGLEQEFYLARPGPSAIGTSWHVYQAEISSCATMNKSCWFQPSEFSASGSSQSGEYALASYMLAANGQQFLGVGNAVPQTPRWCRLGAPTSSPHQIGAAWRRYFRWGVAVVNPTNKALTVSLGGSYVDARGRTTTGLVLQPASGAILRTSPPGPARVSHRVSSNPWRC
jgi:Hypothetical glycosyl hydrolase family 15